MKDHFTCTCHSGNNDCKEHPINKDCPECERIMVKYGNNYMCIPCKYKEDEKEWKRSERKKACQEMIEYMEEKTKDISYTYEDDEGMAAQGAEDAIEAAKEYLKTL